MKKIILVLLTVLAFNLSRANNEPTLVLEFHNVEATKLNSLKTDTEFCCIFEIKSVKSEVSVTKVIHKESGIVLGTFYGTPTKEFIMEIYKTRLTPEYIKSVVPKLASIKENE